MTETRLPVQPKTAPSPSFTVSGGSLLQRQCACGGPADLTGEREWSSERSSGRRSSGQGLSLQRSTENSEPETRNTKHETRNTELETRNAEQGSRNSGGVPPIVDEVLRSPGQPLDALTRAFMEPRFGHDFSKVRVHADPSAAQSARAVNALAYTVGQHTVFAAGRYAPGTSAGKHLLAHELTHTIQQQRTQVPAVQGKLSVSSPTDASEIEADAVADAIIHGAKPAIAAAPGESQLARQSPGDAGEQETPTPTPAPSATDAVPTGGDAGAPDAGAPDAGTPAPACPIVATGTLSEVSWGETSGLYPSDQNKYQPEKWDPAKTCELLKMRGAIHAVGQRGQSVHKSKPKAGDAIEQKLKVYHLTENFPALDSEISDTEVKWFYLSPQSDGPEVHPGTTGTTRVKGYGSFYNIGGGDVKKGDCYVHFYKLKPKTP